MVIIIAESKPDSRQESVQIGLWTKFLLLLFQKIRVIDI